MIYILLPAYNEEKSLMPLLGKIDSYFKNQLKQEYLIIACDDGSTDQTLAILEREKENMAIEIIKHKMNRGLGETIRDLFEMAAELSKEGDIIIRMDCDDTHEPKHIKGLIDKINEGYDVVIASRFVPGGGQEGLSNGRIILSRLANVFMKVFFPIKGLKEYSSGYRAYRASTIKKAISFFGNDFIQLKGLGFTCTLEKIVKLQILGSRIGEAPMVLKYNQKVSASKMISSVTTLGYVVLVILYHWPMRGWKYIYRNCEKLH